jgi:anti-anti-sigma factor
MDNFSITSERNGDITIVTVSGRVDSVTAASMDSELAKIEHDNKKIVLDLKDVAYMSSAGIRAIVKVLQSTQKTGGGVRLANLPDNVIDVLETVGMTQMVETYPTVDEAVAGF